MSTLFHAANTCSAIIALSLHNPYTCMQQDYQTYVSRKAQKRQSLIVTLSDHNQQELKSILDQREEMVKDYEEKRAGLYLFFMNYVL